jgi:hypothetical protein
MKSLMRGVSSHRVTTSRSRAGSTQMTFPPAPSAKKLLAGAAAYCARPVLSHHM